MAITGNAASRAEQAADDAVKAVGLALDAKNETAKHAATVRELVPDPHAEIVRELASHERSGLLNIGPKRNRWIELQAFDEQLVEIERRREELGREIAELPVLGGDDRAEPVVLQLERPAGAGRECAGPQQHRSGKGPHP
jgi:hypothetical protein